MGFTKAELEGYRDATVPDLIGPGCKLLFVGINPGLWTAATGAHFARRGNRFWPALFRAGIIERPIDPSDGMAPEDSAYVISRGIGISNLAPRATARADELTTDELRSGAETLEKLVADNQVRVVAVAGITAYRAAFDRRKAAVGRQPEDLAGAQLWVVPNPSGLNAHDTVESLAAAYSQVGTAAGVMVPG
ncbi:mismatch-specific DNA-glycosylase [Antrihabitans sp. NCIMB 15449]|uniref:Mismatch-specific DNA-glycosylase n=1 Tax=Antrihabitans spumae TaxID=3373370 RepID=A0ABW7JRJ8_9NOCA